LQHCELRYIEESEKICPDGMADVLRRVLTERLGNKDTRVIQQQIDPSEFLNGGRNDLAGRLRMAYVALHESHLRCLRQSLCRRKAPSICNDAISICGKPIYCFKPDPA